VDVPDKLAFPGARNASITAEMIQQAHQMVGVWLRRDVHWPSYAEPVALIDIRRWAQSSVGDDNPLWCDPEYAARSMWGSVIAPPTFLYTIDSTIVAPGFRGIQWIYGGTRWEHYRPVRVGDLITARARVTKVQEKQGNHAETFVIQTGEVLYVNQRDELVSRAEADVLRVPRRRSGTSGSLRGFEDRHERWKYSPEDIEEIRLAYLTEERRGSEPRYWEDVQVGDALPLVVKGPLTLVDIMAFYAGRRNTYRALKLAFLEREEHPANVYVSPATGIPMHPAAGHMDDEIAREIGMPRAYDQGWMRANWGAHLITNWAGDQSFVRAFNSKLLIPNLVGDTTWMKGVVTATRVAGAEHLVDIDYEGTNQRGERNVTGSASVRLPSRGLGDRFTL
jgi:acyl dehydratase